MADHLKKRKYAQTELFVIDALDVAIKDDMASMEHPIYSLSKTPSREVANYEYKGTKIEFQPSIKGFPTIYDKDLIIYAISHLIAALDDDEDPPQEIEFNPYDFLVFTERSTGGRAYEALGDSMDRLSGSRFKTNATINGQIIDRWRGIVDEAELITDGKTKRPQKLRIKLSSMVMETIKQKKVLTLNRDYFLLKKPIERRLYELARKHCGQQDKWNPFLATLHLKSGSKASLREFRRSVKEIVKTDHLPDYHITFDADFDQICFSPRQKFLDAFTPKEESDGLPPVGALRGWAYEQASKILAGTEFDKYALEGEWRSYWKKSGSPKLENPEAAYVGYCKNYTTRH